uniref:PIF1/LRR1 pleckstrin homology domain-containing protein n=1 Tax=Anolis carolinensis TaxID=28377 RepID=A0A803U1E2_ANOCA
MRLPCEVSVSSRLLPSAGLRGPGRAIRAVLSLGRAAGGGSGARLLLSTARNRPGSHYQLRENVEHLFTKFVEEGKATVRLKEPAVDLHLSKVGPHQEGLLYSLWEQVALLLLKLINGVGFVLASSF